MFYTLPSLPIVIIQRVLENEIFLKYRKVIEKWFLFYFVFHFVF